MTEKSFLGLPNAVGLLGGGIIGGGWAARFLLSGIDVKLFDPAPGAANGVRMIVDSARHAYIQMGMCLPSEGRLTVVESLEEAVQGVALLQESAPERADLKKKLLADASKAAAPDLLICSSTSGFMPSELQEAVEHPERLIVAHPFNPVYLLPLVELCGGPLVPHSTLQHAAEIFRTVGMHPLVMKKEIGGFIANRIQEAIWREGLWLVNNDIATLEEIDDAIRFSFGLRLAIKGPFHYGGGGAVFRESLQKFGPDVRDLWTDFPAPAHDVPFINKLVAQAESRADKSGAVEVQEKRDKCLVEILQALRNENYGAGQAFMQWEETLRSLSLAHPRE